MVLPDSRKHPGGSEEKTPLGVGLNSTNFKAEAEAIKTGAAHAERSADTSIFADALSALQALEAAKDGEKLNNLSPALTSLCSIHAVVLRGLPSHCNVLGDETADTLAKEGTTKEQGDRSTTLKEVKTVINASQHSKRRGQQPSKKSRPLSMQVSTARGRVNSLERSQDRYQCQSAQQGDRSTAFKEVKTVINASQHSKGTGQQHSKKSKTVINASQHSKWRQQHPHYKIRHLPIICCQNLQAAHGPQPSEPPSHYQVQKWYVRTLPLSDRQHDNRIPAAFMSATGQTTVNR